MDNYAQYVIRQTVKPACGREVCDFMEQIGATLMGVKPASILSIRAAECLDVCKKNFLKDSPLAFVIIRDANGGKQIFLYHKERLGKVLQDNRVRRYLTALGYPPDGTTDGFVRVLAKKLRGGDFPHEIGIFLGYPLKDVYGFMGAKIPYRKTMGWRMYGDIRASEAAYHSFRDARGSVRRMLASCHTQPEVCAAT